MASKFTNSAENYEDGNSSDEALCEMLGLKSLDAVIDEEIASNSHEESSSVIQRSNLFHTYKMESICQFPKELCLSSSFARRLADELIWGGEKVEVDRTYEVIKVLNKGEVQERRVLTRLENFVNFHREWSSLCHGHLANCISALCGESMVLFKEKLNLKPPGGSGFAPHLDTPSLRISFGKEGPQTFVTVMVAIDSMKKANGCLRLCKGEWSEKNHCATDEPEEKSNPDAGGRAGAIPLESAQNLQFDDVECEGGAIYAFNGWAPHRSSPNGSLFPRRAVFLTYNPKREGDFHNSYYDRMRQLRNKWREQIGLEVSSKQLMPDEKAELDALATIPRI
mmetsp:Transcript_31238/g.46107  ORF Transcript_31238/g.46107 Transcript_31238/m.46107 type:complete len:338 (+) Transcript_31238:163-1176(+)